MSKRNVSTNGQKPSLFKPSKTECPLTAQAFLDHAAPLTISVNGEAITGEASPRVFSSGSFGYFINGKIVLNIAGRAVKCQVSGNVVVVGSRDAARS
jgi:hypothetical protein